jgi:hypothetical protein
VSDILCYEECHYALVILLSVVAPVTYAHLSLIKIFQILFEKKMKKCISEEIFEDVKTFFYFFFKEF